MSSSHQKPTLYIQELVKTMAESPFFWQ